MSAATDTGEQCNAGHIYTDPEFLAALRQCRSVAVRTLVIRLDSLAVFLRADAIDPLEVADELKGVVVRVLALASERQQMRTAT